MCTLWQTQGKVERLQATEEAAPESWDPSQHQYVAQVGHGHDYGTQCSGRIWIRRLGVSLGL